MSEIKESELKRLAYLDFYNSIKEKLTHLHEFNSDGINHFKENDVIDAIESVKKELDSKL